MYIRMYVTMYVCTFIYACIHMYIYYHTAFLMSWWSLTRISHWRHCSLSFSLSLHFTLYWMCSWVWCTVHLGIFRNRNLKGHISVKGSSFVTVTMYVCMYIVIYICVYIHTYVYTYTYLSLVFLYVCMYMHMCVCMSAYINYVCTYDKHVDMVCLVGLIFVVL